MQPNIEEKNNNKISRYCDDPKSQSHPRFVIIFARKRGIGWSTVSKYNLIATVKGTCKREQFFETLKVAVRAENVI